MFTSLATGSDHTCGVVAAGGAYCWGSNTHGQLGDGSTSNRASPSAVAGGLAFQSVAPGALHTCGVTTDGAAYCWGSNAYGQLGDGTTTDRLTPTPVAGSLAFRSVATGDGHSCGLAATGATYCWGRNGWGQLGDSSTTDRLTPARVAGGLTFQSLALGLAHSCGMTPAGVGYCWGDYCCGELGIGAVPVNQIVSAPARIVGGLAFRGITAFAEHTCGITTSSAVYCWGSDIGNLLGTGVLGYYVAQPTAVVGTPPLQSLKTGATHTCGLTSGGDAYCWGLPNDPVGTSLNVAALGSSAARRPGPRL
jgi:alpha-tubulin suppressor-like RCC1 family protein